MQFKSITEERGLLLLTTKEAIMIKKHHAGISMNDKHEQRKGIGIQMHTYFRKFSSKN